MGEKPSGNCRETTAKGFSLLAKHLGSFKHDQNQKNIFLCYIAALKYPISINTNYSNVICIEKLILEKNLHLDGTDDLTSDPNNPRSGCLSQTISSFPQHSSTKVHRKINVLNPNYL